MDDPILQACHEIHAGLRGRYDREAVRDYLREAFRLNIEERNAERGETVSRSVINDQVEQGAAEVEKVLWESLDSALAMGIKALMMTAASVYLPPIAQRIGAPESKVREEQEAKRNVRNQIIKVVLTPWLEQFSPLFSHAGRPPTGDDQKEWEASAKEEELETLRAALDEIVEVWAKKEDAPKMTLAKLGGEMGRRGHAMSPSTLKRKLRKLDEDMESIKLRIEQKRLKIIGGGIT